MGVFPDRARAKGLKKARGGVCEACGYNVEPALAIHHIVPRHLGGGGEESNLAVLCANCHRLTHHFGTKAYDDKPIPRELLESIGSGVVAKLQALSGRLRAGKSEVHQNGNVTADACDLDEAVDTVAKKNHLDDEQTDDLRECVQMVLDRMPRHVAEQCSYKLVSTKNYISFKIMNYLIFRVPAYNDGGGKPSFVDSCFLMYPGDLDIEMRTADDWYVAFNFADFGCIDICLTWDELLDLTEDQWDLFAEACETAAGAKKSREWTSNIRVNL